MNVLTLDVETTISNKGNPFDKTNKLIYVGAKLNDEPTQLFSIEYGDTPYVNHLQTIQDLINKSDWLVGFNIKFDLHWLRKYKINFSNSKIWDCQLAYFMLTGQENVYPSLNSVAEVYNLGTKIDTIKEEYWSNGIDTTEIPEDLLKEYLTQDVNLTYQVYNKQRDIFKQDRSMYNLFYLHGIDLLALQEIEYNGILYEQKQSEVLANELDEQIGKLDRRLYEYHRQDDFNLNSNDHLSSLLYGGSISFKRKVDDGFYKSGAKKGEPKQKWETYEVEFPRLVNPLKGSELKKEGYYSTDEKTLKMLKGAKELIDLLLARAVLQKRLTTYYRGLNELITESNWDYGMIHGQLNQCVARTGRLSSSKPNLQNFDGEIKTLFTSRYKEA